MKPIYAVGTAFAGIAAFAVVIAAVNSASAAPSTSNGGLIPDPKNPGKFIPNNNWGKDLNFVDKVLNKQSTSGDQKVDATKVQSSSAGVTGSQAPSGVLASKTPYSGFVPVAGSPWYVKITGDKTKDDIQYEIVRILTASGKDGGGWDGWRAEAYAGKHGWVWDQDSAAYTIYSTAREAVGLSSDYGNLYDYAYPDLSYIISPGKAPGLFNWLANNEKSILNAVKAYKDYTGDSNSDGG